MAIETKINLSENRELESAYIKIVNPYSFKTIDGKEEKLKLGYHVETYSEKDGMKLKTEVSKYVDYQGGDIWSEAYSDLKKVYANSKDV